MDVEPKFREKRTSGKKNNLMKNIENKVMKSPQESFRIDYFLYIVDKAITTLVKTFIRQVYRVTSNIDL